MTEENIGRGSTKPIMIGYTDEDISMEPSEQPSVDLKEAIDDIDNSKPVVEGVSPIQREKRKPKSTAYLITEEMTAEEAKKISGLNFLALAQYKRELKKQIEDMDTTKQLIEMFEKITKDDTSVKSDKEYDFGKEVALSNIKNDLDLATAEEMQEFKNNYDQNMVRLNETMRLVEEREEELKGIKMTSSYMNQCMLEVLDDKTKVLNEQTGKQFKKVKYYYKNIREIYDNRDSLEFISEQVKPNIHYVQRIVNDLKKEKKNGRDGANLTKSLQQNVTNTFCKLFKINQLIAFEKYLKEILESATLFDEGQAAFLFNYLLYIIYINEKRKYKGYHKWVESLIMNVLDILSGNYDLEKDKDEFNDELVDIISNMMNLLNL